MPKRKNAPRLKLVVEFEMDRPDPPEITKQMADQMHQNILLHVSNAMPKQVGFADGSTCRLVRVTKVVK